MTALSLTLTPEAVGKVHEALVCLGKFSESVSIEARRNKLVLSALNSSKSAHASFTLDVAQFCSKYHFVPPQTRVLQGGSGDEGRFTCSIYNKALLSVFKGRLPDAREKDTSVEKCELTIKDRPDAVECRLIVKMFCRHGVLKTYRLTYESVEVMHALFDKSAAKNRWTISARVLKEFVEHFGPKTEQLDFYSENGRATFTSYTEKIMDGKEILRQPLQTSVTIDTIEFEDFVVEDKLHIAISVKDFKAIVTHGDTLTANISSLYSYPTRPLQFTYDREDMLAEFTLMTIGNYRGATATPAPIARDVSHGSAAHQRAAPSDVEVSRNPPSHDAPATRTPAPRSFRQEAASQRQQRPSPPPPKPTLDEDSLFLPHGDEDRRWDPNVSGDEEEDMLGWDPLVERGTNRRVVDVDGRGQSISEGVGEADSREQRIPPTQRVSQVQGLFD